MESVIKKETEIKEILTSLEVLKLEPGEINDYLENYESALTTQKIKASNVLLRPQVSIKSLINAVPSVQKALQKFPNDALEQAEIQIKYQVYIQKEEEMVKKLGQLETQIIPENFNYGKVASLSNEARQKFQKIKPQTLGQASRISGVNPSDVQILMVYIGR
jgi:tRNA uridine 5-carboxymethylaminomethyl modification enzyme